MNQKWKLYLLFFGAVVIALMATNFVGAQFNITDESVEIPVIDSLIGGFGVPLIEAGMVTLFFIVFYVKVLKKKQVPT